MRVVGDLPRVVEETEHCFVPLSDGARLGARLWLPEGAADAPVPAILEYIPYRKADRTARRDAVNHRYFAGHGYACVRVDLRGSGDSDGVLTDEYLERELADGEDVLAWIRSRPWCDGRVGMIGISWGGFNGLQLAARRPEGLDAVVTVCSTDDRYADDVHYMGGCLLGDNLSWASYMFAINTLPPDPRHRPEDWRERWHERLAGSGLWLEHWLRHQRRDDYWRHGSICEDYDAVEAPVLAVSGWADGYSNAVFRLVRNLRCPVKGIVGPWSHSYPHMGTPGPAIGFLEECLRWWDHWLKGRNRGVEADPAIRAWMQDSAPPRTRAGERPGRWVGEPCWPPAEERTSAWRLTRAGLEPETDASGEPAAAPPMRLASPLSTGLYAGKWCSYAAGPDLPHDQRAEDGGALVFETAPLEAPREILGAPEVELELIPDRPVAMVAVRLSDVDPRGRATRVTYGVLNLTHRDSHAEPKPLEPGEPVRVCLAMNEVAQHFPAGHRLRLSISSSYFPLAWPPPEAVQLEVNPARSRLRLPERPVPAGEERVPVAPEPAGAAPVPVTTLQPAHHEWVVRHDLGEDRAQLLVTKDEGRVRFEETGLEIVEHAVEDYAVVGEDPSSVRCEVITEIGLARDDWRVHSRTRTVLTADATHFHVHAEQDAWEGEVRVDSRNWRRSIPRDLV